ncbi:MAG: succinylglutamate desuccinylase [Sulfurovum sp. PC08-66]|nr:MAG: succinylglutamate desuccinylase [Sulfurovum sp. PC08-66]KIM12690.1 MAG: succinylglutamate desuccinylase [Sulfuricurvum sp. PC08-66]
MNTLEDVITIELPVSETLKIKRNRFYPDNATSLEGLKRASIVTGTHGDELEGQYVLFLLSQWLRQNSHTIRGIIDLYPALNALGIDSITRSVPFYNVDLNRVFPGSKNDFLPAQIAEGIVEVIAGSALAIDIHSSNIFLREIPQVRMSVEYAPQLLPLANYMGIDFVWIHDAVTVLESTFAHAMNTRGTKTLVVEMGVGMRVTQSYGHDLLEGILNVLAFEGLILRPLKARKLPITSEKGEVFYLNANASGLFVPALEHSQRVKAGEKIGQIVSALTGEVLEEIFSPANGLLFTLREYPIVYEGSLIARIFGGQS